MATSEQQQALTYYNDVDSYCCAVLRQHIAQGNLPKGDVDERDIRIVQAADLIRYTHWHLFAGIGAFPLGFTWAGVPSSLRMLTGGFPCQDISDAGKRAGITGPQSGLWTEMVRLLRNLRPDYVLVENVAALAHRGLDRVLGDLAACGYDAEWVVLRASDIGAPHRRERIFVVAYPHGDLAWLEDDHTSHQQNGDLSYVGQRTLVRCPHGSLSTERAGAGSEALADATCLRCNRGCSDRQGGYLLSHADWDASPQATNGQGGQYEPEPIGQTLADASGTRLVWSGKPAGEPPTCLGRESRAWANKTNRTVEPVLGRMFDGVSPWLDGACWPSGPNEAQKAWEPPRVVLEAPAYRVARLHALGNSLLPQLVAEIARCVCLHAQQRGLLPS